MNITQKLAKYQLGKVKAPVIAFFGDSVTQGCFELSTEAPLTDTFDPEYSYHSKLKKIISLLYPGVPVNIINAGVAGDNSTAAYKRLKRDVLDFSPDLTVVCFGLNDCTGGKENIPVYVKNLKNIFTGLKNGGSEVIFMTPNMICTEVSAYIKDESAIPLAQRFVDIWQSGLFDEYMKAGINAAKECDVTVCDVYSKWKVMYESGVNVTALLANHINHPIRQMHNLFAASLAETIFSI